MKTDKKKKKAIKGLSFEQSDLYATLDNSDESDAYVPANNAEAQDSVTIDSIKVYMRLLSTVPLLSRPQEILHAEGIISARDSLFKLFSSLPEFTELMLAMTDCGGTRLRRIFSPMLIKDAPKEDVLALKTQLFEAAANQANPQSYIEFLNKLSFTFQELEHICEYLKLVSTDETNQKADTHLAQFVYHRKKLVEGNLRLVFHRAKNHANKGLALEDLIQEGNLGLMRAVEKYDVSKGFKFGTYATWWIDQALGRACSEKGRIIRIPTHIMENINRVAKTTKELASRLGYEPALSEISAEVNLTSEKIEMARELIAFPQSIEDQVGDFGSHVGEFIVQSNAMTAYDIMQEQHLCATIQKVIKKLTPKEEMVLRCRFGFGLPQGMVLREVGERIGLTRERVRQIECKALRKLKRLCKFNNVYLGNL